LIQFDLCESVDCVVALWLIPWLSLGAVHCTGGPSVAIHTAVELDLRGFQELGVGYSAGQSLVLHRPPFLLVAPKVVFTNWGSC
jgi:hypothetical protein